MSEIVRLKTVGGVGTVRATYINAETGEELVEVQPVGRTHRNVFLRRVDVEKATQEDLSREMARTVLLAITEVEKSVVGIGLEWILMADMALMKSTLEIYVKDGE